ncbi:hypothetical protein Droror1_Dr00026648 [Drosera rotundifolia]
MKDSSSNKHHYHFVCSLPPLDSLVLFTRKLETLRGIGCDDERSISGLAKLEQEREGDFGWVKWARVVWREGRVLGR